MGIVVQLPFFASPLYTGPAARAMGSVDLSWIAGLIITSPVYCWWAEQSRRAAVALLK
jgi:NCS1 family nucleobase:cation symporter-1